MQTNNVTMSQSLSLDEVPFEKISSRSSQPSSTSDESKKVVVQFNVWYGRVQKVSDTCFQNYTSQKYSLKDCRNWWLAALLFLFAMLSLKLHPPRIKSNSALRTLRQVLCSWWQVLCQCRQALCPAKHKFLLPLVISAQWKGWKRKQSTAFIGLWMYSPVQKRLLENEIVFMSLQKILTLFLGRYN